MSACEPSPPATTTRLPGSAKQTSRGKRYKKFCKHLRLPVWPRMFSSPQEDRQIDKQSPRQTQSSPAPSSPHLANTLRFFNSAPLEASKSFPQCFSTIPNIIKTPGAVFAGGANKLVHAISVAHKLIVHLFLISDKRFPFWAAAHVCDCIVCVCLCSAEHFLLSDSAVMATSAYWDILFPFFEHVLVAWITAQKSLRYVAVLFFGELRRACEGPGDGVGWTRCAAARWLLKGSTRGGAGNEQWAGSDQ